MSALRDLVACAKDCPLGWAPDDQGTTRVLRGRQTSEADLVAWLRRLKELADAVDLQMRDAEAWCGPCLRDDHDACIGFCSCDAPRHTEEVAGRA